MVGEKLDTAFEVFSKLLAEICEYQTKMHTEEDAKFRVISRMLTEVLGWRHDEIHMEPSTLQGYSDYIISKSEYSIINVEAKKIGSLNISASDTKDIKYYKISGPALKGVRDVIAQSARDANSHGCPIAVATDGSCWIIFKPHVSGRKFQDFQAITFQNLESVEKEFSVFYELLSSDGVSDKKYNVIFDAIIHGNRSVQEKLYSPFFGTDIIPQQKSELSFDLEKVFEKFFYRMTDEEDRDMLIHCFVESNESRIADFSLEKITANVLGNLVPQDKDIEGELQNLIENSVESDEGDTVFIVGPTGAGKSTFLERFFEETLSPQIRKFCVVLKANFLDASGSTEGTLNWLTEKLIEEIHLTLYGGTGPNWDELKGLYFGEYKSRAEGAHRALYRSDKSEFERRFGDYLDERVEKSREDYLKRLLDDIVKNRKSLPVFVVDNTDEFDPEIKKAVFQFCQSLRRHISHCIIIFSVNDKSAWAFSKTDIYSIYSSKSFFLPTPSPREVLAKRIDYLRSKLSDEGAVSNDRIRKYFSAKGIKISIDNLSTFADVLEGVFVNTNYASKAVGELANYNIRRSLMLSKRVITSSVFDIDDIVKSYIVGNFVRPSQIKFMNALIKGDYSFFKRGDVPEIFPIFNVHSNYLSSPLLALRILAFLDALRDVGPDIDAKHANVGDILSYFEAMGCEEAGVDSTIASLLEASLVEPYDQSVRSLSPDQRLAISYRGRFHLRMATENTVFFEQMALTTPTSVEDTSDRIRSAFRRGVDPSLALKEVREIFAQYLLAVDQAAVSIPDGAQFDTQRRLTEKVSVFTEKGHVEPALAGGDKDELLVDAGVARVEFFDRSRGFGFARSEDVEGRIYIAGERLGDVEGGELYDGDSVLCEVKSGAKGPYVSKIIDYEKSEAEREIAVGKVIRLFGARGYGFVSLEGRVADAFFHYSMLPPEVKEDLDLGQRLEVEVASGSEGRPQIRRVLSRQ